MIEGAFLVDNVTFTRCESHAVAAGCESRGDLLFIRSLVFDAATGCSLPVRAIRARSFAFVECIYIPRTVELLPDQSFFSCHFLRSVSFESEGALQRIEALAFSFSALESVTVPAGVSFSDQSVSLVVVPCRRFPLKTAFSCRDLNQSCFSSLHWNQSQFHISFWQLGQNAFLNVNHFHQFHLKMIHNCRQSKIGPFMVHR
jgi:hypothetical protein